MRFHYYENNVVLSTVTITRNLKQDESKSKIKELDTHSILLCIIVLCLGNVKKFFIVCLCYHLNVCLLSHA